MDILDYSQNNITITTGGLTTITMNINALLNGYVTTFQLGTSDSSTQDGTLEIIQKGVTLATTTTATAWKFDTAPLITFDISDYSSHIRRGAFQIVYTRTSGSGTTGTASYTTESKETFDYITQDMMGKHSGQPLTPLFTFLNIERTTNKEQELKTNYPVDNGVGDVLNLIPQEGSVVKSIERFGGL